MNKRQRIKQMVELFFDRSSYPTRVDKYFQNGILSSFGLFIVLFLIFMGSGLKPIFGYLMYIPAIMIVLIGIVGIIWRIRDILRYTDDEDKT